MILLQNQNGFFSATNFFQNTVWLSCGLRRSPWLFRNVYDSEKRDPRQRNQRHLQTEPERREVVGRTKVDELEEVQTAKEGG